HRCRACSLVVQVFSYFFFFSSRRRHTRLQGDWSSDVCSSDLPAVARPTPPSRPPPPPEAMSSEVEEEILLDEDLGDDVPPSPQLRAVPSPSAKPPLSVVPPASDRRATGDGGEALLREALSKAS